MALSACKVPINCRLQANLDAFHTLTARSSWSELRQEQRDAYYEIAIAIDKQAIKDYDALLWKMTSAMDARS